jgi:beta-glucanase (GH16 family)
MPFDRTHARPFVAALMVVLTAVLGLTVPVDSGAATTGPSCGPTLLKPGGGSWTCTFADEFSASAIDTTKWRPLLSSETGVQTPECRVKNARTLSQSGGALRLSIVKTSSPITCSTSKGTYQTSYLGGGITSRTKFSQGFGRFEFRAAFPTYRGRGLHSALWLWPEKMVYGDKSGEIDVAEWRSGYPYRVVPTVHYEMEATDPNNVAWDCYEPDPSGYHTYAVEWTLTTLTFLYDGKVCLSDTWLSGGGLRAPAPFNETYFLILNQALGGGYNSVDEKTVFPATMAVDYVHVWR